MVRSTKESVGSIMMISGIQTVSQWLMAAGLVLFLHAHVAVAVPDPGAAAQEKRQIEILSSDAGKPDKALACKRLAIYGTEAAVPLLAPLLADAELASWARIALEAIPGEEADAALRNAMDGLEGRLRVGVINSVGVRRDAAAVPALIALLEAGEDDTVPAAAAALGAIGGDAAAAALTKRLAAAPARQRSDIAEGCVRCAERFLADGEAGKAIGMYDGVRAAAVSPQRTIEATRGAIVARGDAGVPMLAELLASPDPVMFGVGLRVAREMPGEAVESILAREFGRTDARRRPGLLLALADRGDAAVLKAATAAVAGADLPLRFLGVAVLDRLENPAAFPALLTAATSGDKELAVAATTALTRLPGTAVDAEVVRLLRDAAPQRRALAVDLLMQRGNERAVTLLLKAVRDPDETVRRRALKGLGIMAGTADLPALLNLLVQSRTAGELRAAESAVISVCTRSATPSAARVEVSKAVYGDLPAGAQVDVTKKIREMVSAGNLDIKAGNGLFGDPAGGIVKKLRVDFSVDGRAQSLTVAENETVSLAAAQIPPVCTDAVLAVVGDAPVEPKMALLRVLRAIGSSGALTTVRKAAADTDAKVRETAWRALCDWPNADALPDLERLARMSDNPTFRILALRGYIRLAAGAVAKTDERLALLTRVTPLVQRTAEKRLFLGALGGIPSPQALAIVAPYLDDPGLKEEACASIVTIGEGIPKPRPAAVKRAAGKAAKATGNRKLAARAKALLAD